MALTIVPIQPAPSIDFAPIRALVLDAVSSPLTRVMYAKALDDFFAWQSAQALPFSRASVMAHRAHLQVKDYAPATINQRLAAIRKLATEAAANGLMDYAAAAAIEDVPGVPKRGIRLGNWLTPKESQRLVDAPDVSTLKGKRDRAALALLVGCGLRRSEISALHVTDVQQREGRWVIIDLKGKGGRIRTVPVPAGVKARLDAWTEAAGIIEGPLVRSVDRHGKVGGSISGQGILDMVGTYAAISGTAGPSGSRLPGFLASRGSQQARQHAIPVDVEHEPAAGNEQPSQRNCAKSK
jgi:site-specific recombinase XerD